MRLTQLTKASETAKPKYTPAVYLALGPKVYVKNYVVQGKAVQDVGGPGIFAQDGLIKDGDKDNKDANWEVLTEREGRNSSETVSHT